MSGLIPILAMASCAVLAVAAAFHFYWGFGGKIGLGVSLPQFEDGTPIMKHSPAAAHFVGVILCGGIVCVSAYIGVLSLPVPATMLRLGTLMLALVFTMRGLSWHKYFGLFKSVRHTRFAKYDTRLYSPLCLFVGLALSYAVLKG